jgi:hypothetical protein
MKDSTNNPDLSLVCYRKFQHEITFISGLAYNVNKNKSCTYLMRQKSLLFWGDEDDGVWLSYKINSGGDPIKEILSQKRPK